MFSGMRLRQSANVRGLLSETRLDVSRLIMPVFVREELSKPVEVASMPGVFQFPLSGVVDEVTILYQLGIRAVILFGIPLKKEASAVQAKNLDGVVQQAIRLIKLAVPEMVIIADCCLCEYTDHGHCSLFDQKGQLDLPNTLRLLGEIAASYAASGADIVAPSGMLDGMVAAIRQALDEAGFSNTLILSYAVKYASSLYGPFRDAGGSSLGVSPTLFSDRAHHQMQPSQRCEALLEAGWDVTEGADMVMVKPAGWYLDIISEVKSQFLLPLVAYQVSGEYAMIKSGSEKGWMHESDVVKESLLAIRRAGADLIITYFAKQVAQVISGKEWI